MKGFTQLLENLELAREPAGQAALLAGYLRELPDEEKSAALKLLTGGNFGKRCLDMRQLTEWALELSGIPEWLMQESGKVAGDAAETIALLIPLKGIPENRPLVYWMEAAGRLPALDPERRKAWVTDSWRILGPRERVIFNKLLCKSLRPVVSSEVLVAALSRLTGIDTAILTWRLSLEKAAVDGNDAPSFYRLTKKETLADEHARPYPFFPCPDMADACEPANAQWMEDRLGPAEAWTAQWKRAGLPAQVIHRDGQLHIWMEGALVTDRFPELREFINRLPAGTVLEGELLVLRDGMLLPAAGLEKRMGRKSLPKSLLTQLPAVFLATDCLEYEGADIRRRPAADRRRLLESLQKRVDHIGFRCSGLIPFDSWEQLAAAHACTRDQGAEGILLKKNDAPVASDLSGANDRWHWKATPYIFRGVLLYARREAGGGAFTQFSLGAWQQGKLVSVATVSSTLDSSESEELGLFIRENSVEKFGPVRTVRPGVVFEIAFDDILPSPRHRAGFRLCSPRMLRWLKSVQPEEAGMLESLRNLCRQ